MASEFLLVAEQILESQRRPMRPAELVDYAHHHRLFSDRIAGKTPQQTMKSKLSVHVRRHGDDSPFVRTAPGKFYLRRLLNGFEPVYQAPPFRKPRAKERVLVFSTAWLGAARRFQGIARSTQVLAKKLLSKPPCTYMDRLEAEQNNDFKQILTYVLLTRGDQVLAFKRGSFSRVEDFLRGAHCIGFGGHVTELDSGLFATDLGVEQCVIRELCEELKLPTIDQRRLHDRAGLRLIGLLNDDSSQVGQRHFAFVYRYEVSNDSSWDQPERGEKSVTQLRWLDLGKESVDLWEFEYWSQLCLREYWPQSVRAAPAYRLRRKRPLTPPHVLCVLGGLGSGKSEATRILVNEFDYTEISTRQLVARLIGLPPVPATPREIFQERAWKFIRTRRGPAKLAQAISAEVARINQPRILVDGIRQLGTLDCLRSQLADRRLGLLYVHTPPDLAYQFYRDREANEYSITDFLRVRNAPVEREVDQMIGLSDAVLYNWAGRARYRRALHELMEKLAT